MTLQTTNGAIAVTRFGLGARPGELDAASVEPQGWLKAQITPSGGEQPQGPLPTGRAAFAAYTTALQDFRQIKRDTSVAAPPGGVMKDGAPDDLKARRKALLAPIRDGVRDEIVARTRLATTTAQPFRERWTLFWANHFTVSAAKPKAAMLAGPFEREAIRPHVFGRFETLLVASSTHPGMLMYLDQARSTGPDSLAGTRRDAGLNENLAREILELHTVGPDSGYTQADVIEFARALTGYSIGVDRDGGDQAGLALFRPNLHEPGARTVLGRTCPAGGSEQARAILADLATNPHTADHLARKLAIHFVADDPPPALVARLREAWTDSRGDLSTVALALVEAPDAWTPQPAKFKRPYELLVSSYRAMGAIPADGDREVIAPLTQMGDRPFTAPQPDGWSEQASDWAAPDAVVKRLDWASGLSTALASAAPSPMQVADAALGDRLTAPVRTAIARAETRPEALTLLFMSPEFQRR
ncbi:DUF1800 family protein [Caulobacter sp. S45]|uniref:DUF1800 domain-containing protein n=1 Tax=Caulobacter sp. S45 TaxID=1641861 RepID=UPI0015753DFE|nr:DUF1800 family protein [Caulobacter sp. S45]